MDTEIRTWLIRLLLGEVTLAEFEEWLIPATWELGFEDAGAELAASLTLVLAERDRGHVREEELRSEFRRLLHTVTLGQPAERATGSSATTHPAAWAVRQLVAAGR